MDLDGSGTIEFDEFVKVIQMLHPLQHTRRSAAEQATAFDHLCLGDLTSLPRKGFGDRRAGDRLDVEAEADTDAARLRLRGTVPCAARHFAGAVVGNMRDAGFEDADTVQVLQALFPPRKQHEDIAQATPQRSAW